MGFEGPKIMINKEFFLHGLRYSVCLGKAFKNFFCSHKASVSINYIKLREQRPPASRGFPYITLLSHCIWLSPRLPRDCSSLSPRVYQLHICFVSHSHRGSIWIESGFMVAYLKSVLYIPLYYIQIIQMCSTLLLMVVLSPSLANCDIGT